MESDFCIYEYYNNNIIILLKKSFPVQMVGFPI